MDNIRLGRLTLEVFCSDNTVSLDLKPCCLSPLYMPHKGNYQSIIQSFTNLSTSTFSNTIHRGLVGGIYSSIRCVHWFHNAKQVGAPRDTYELFNRQREFGQGEINDKDRYPHLYWNLWKGRS